MNSTFLDWNLLDPSSERVHTQSENLSGLKFDIVSKLKRDDVVLKTKESLSIRLRRSKTMQIGELPLAFSMSVPETVNVEVPYDFHYEFDSQGNLLREIVPDDESIKKSVASCILSISDQIGPDKMWNIEGGLLRRRLIV